MRKPDGLSVNRQAEVYLLSEDTINELRNIALLNDMSCARKNKCFLYLTSNNPKKTVSQVGLMIRRLLYPLIRRLSGPLTGVKGVLLDKASLPKGPKVFAVTHTYSREDIAWGISLAGEQSYLMTNAKRELLDTSDGYALWASGIILVDRYDKENRKAAIEKAKRVLELGGNIMIFPEAVWNMSENLLVRKLYSGVYRIAEAAKAPVIPMSTMLYGDYMYVIRGEAIDMNTHNQEDGLRILRDSLATGKWKIMENYGKTTRSDLLQGRDPKDFWKEDIESYIAKQTVYEREDEAHAHFVDDNDLAMIEVKNSMNRIIPSQANAFLFNQKQLYLN